MNNKTKRNLTTAVILLATYFVLLMAFNWNRNQMDKFKAQDPKSKGVISWFRMTGISFLAIAAILVTFSILFEERGKKIGQAVGVEV